MRFAVLAILSFTVAADAADKCDGIWSATGQRPHVGDSFTSDAIESPDKQYTLTISEENVLFNFGNRPQTALSVPNNPTLMEIVWAPSSKAFAINVSDGNSDGPWRALVYRIDQSGTPKLIVLDADIAKAAASLLRCAKEQSANVSLVQWRDASDDFILALEVPLIASCANKGEVLGLRVAGTSGNIIERIPQKALLQNAPALGCRLRKE